MEINIRNVPVELACKRKCISGSVVSLSQRETLELSACVYRLQLSIPLFKPPVNAVSSKNGHTGGLSLQNFVLGTDLSALSENAGKCIAQWGKGRSREHRISNDILARETGTPTVSAMLNCCLSWLQGMHRTLLHHNDVPSL